MLDYVVHRPLLTRSQPNRFGSLVVQCLFILSLCLVDLHGQSALDHSSLRTMLQRRQPNPARRLLRVVYFRKFDVTVDETRLRNDVRNVTESFGIDFRLNILNQSSSLLATKLCAILSQEPLDTVLIADLYTKEIDLISRSLQMPTIAITNGYQLVQGKQHNPYLFKYMTDPVEEAKSMAFALETRSVYRRIALIYDTSLDMIEYRFAYLPLAKQHIIYRAHLPRVSRVYELRRAARKIILDLAELQIDLVLCLMSTEREIQFVRLINEIGSVSVTQLLLNRTSWWFASGLGEFRTQNYMPKIYTANEDRRRLLGQFSISTMRILLNAVLRTYNGLPVSFAHIGSTNCARRSTAEQLTRTNMFIRSFTNFAEWNCDIRVGTGINLILFDPKTLVWRFPTIFMVHTEHACQGMLTRTFNTVQSNAEQLFRSCRPISASSRNSSSSSTQQDHANHSLSSTGSSNALVDLANYHQMYGIFARDALSTACRFVHIQATLQTPIIVGVVEQPYIFVSDTQVSADFHCNSGILCYQIDPAAINFTSDALLFHSSQSSRPHCCYGISINLLLRMEDTSGIFSLDSKEKTKLFVFADKPTKWLALLQALQTRRAHLSISAIPHESFLTRAIDLSPPFYHSSYVILTAPAPMGMSLGAFLQPFSWITWCMIFLVLTVTACFETFFEWNSPYGLTPKGRRRAKVFSLGSALTLSWSIIFSHTFKTKSPKCWSNRFLGNVWGGFGIVFIAIYTAKLAAFMVEIGRTHTASTIGGIIEVCHKMPRCTVGVVANTSDEEHLRRLTSRTLYEHIHYVSSYSHGIDLLRDHAITYLLMDHSMARYYLTRDVFKLVRISDDEFGTFGLSLGFSKFNGDLKDNITNMLLSYMSKGIIQRLHDEWYVYEHCETKRLNENRVLTVDRFFGVFIMLMAGMLVGLLILMIEWLTFKYAVPYWRRRGWTGWMFCSQRLFAALNASDEVFDQVRRTSDDGSSRYVGERLHSHTTRSDSLDLRAVNVPKLLRATYQLKEKMYEDYLPHRPNGNIGRAAATNDVIDDRQSLWARIDELEQEVDHLKSQLRSTGSLTTP